MPVLLDSTFVGDVFENVQKMYRTSCHIFTLVCDMTRSGPQNKGSLSNITGELILIQGEMSWFFCFIFTTGKVTSYLAVRKHFSESFRNVLIWSVGVICCNCLKTPNNFRFLNTRHTPCSIVNCRAPWVFSALRSISIGVVDELDSTSATWKEPERTSSQLGRNLQTPNST